MMDKKQDRVSSSMAHGSQERGLGELSWLNMMLMCGEKGWTRVSTLRWFLLETLLQARDLAECTKFFCYWLHFVCE